MFKKRKTILFVIIIIGMIYSASRGVEYVSMPGRAIKKINEDYYNIKINVNEKKVMVDGNEMELSDFLGVSDKKVDGMIEENSINEYLENNLIGNMKISDDGISVFNPFSTDGLSIEVEDGLGDDVIQEYDTVTKYKEIIKNRFILSFKNAEDTKAAYDRFKNDSRVKRVVYNYRVYARENNFSAKDVAQGKEAWGVKSTGLENYSKKINYTGNAPTVKVAVLDSGIRGTHEVFNITDAPGKIDYTLSHDYGDDDDDVTDDMGHGTMVSGVIAEATSNNVSILPIKIMDEDGNGDFNDILDALSDAVGNVDIVNMSLGANVNDMEYDGQFEEICSYFDEYLQEFYDQGLIMVCAAGNDGNQVDFPGCSPYTLTASAVDADNAIADFSCFGDEVDFALPGVSVSVPRYSGDTDYAWSNGTSIATPFLSSAVAEILSEHGTSINRTELTEILKQNAVDLGDTGKDVHYGYGSINFNSNMFNKPDIIGLNINDTAWSLSSSVSVKAICGNSITNYALTQLETEPSQWQNVSSPSTDVDININVVNNGTNYVWVKDSLGNISHKSFEVRYVDSIAPVVNSISYTEKSNNSFTIRIATEDDLSGVSKINWYKKSSSETNYTMYTEIIESNGSGRTEAFTLDRVFTGLNSDTDYSVYADVFDMVGNHTVSNTLSVKTEKDGRNIIVTNYTNQNAMVSIGGETNNANHTFVSTENSLRVTCADACIVLLKISENEYEEITGSGSGEVYDFNLGNNQENDIEVTIALRGDVDLNGSIDLTDAVTIRESRLSPTDNSYVQLSVLQEKIADVNKSGSVNLSDAVSIRKSKLSPGSANYQKIEW